MCLAVPGRITAVENGTATVDFGGGVVREASVKLVPAARAGDFVLVHAGFAIQVITEKDARETVAAYKEIYQDNES